MEKWLSEFSKETKDDLPTGVSLDALLAIYNPFSHSFHMCTVGHHLGCLIWVSSTGVVKWSVSEHPAIVRHEKVGKVEKTTVKLEKDDRMLLFTRSLLLELGSGITSDGAEILEKIVQLSASFNSDDFMRFVIDGVKNASRHGLPAQDICLLAFRRKQSTQ